MESRPSMMKAMHHFSSLYLRRKPILLLLLACLWPLSLKAEPQQYKLQQVKTAILFNIAKFVRWPETSISQSPDYLTICHYRENTLSPAFQSIYGKRAQHRIVNDKLIDTLAEADQCAMLFIPFAQLRAFTEDQAHHGPLPVLTIADLTQSYSIESSDSRAAVNLIRQGSRIGLDIYLPEVTRNGLTISSELLKLARIRR
ncbi:YfiR family protein [uncultured Amphritea sp.]|uniref:YfiR family protein n=1 Tax=uncultured Amphritea sp. TaxID=981605 RepID=UPI0025F7A0E2|nr:YfiR family protein [uncultured Amphritea sp.]